ncbi:MAG: GNAT family N-acetyltransferase [Gemmatimonadota bacterium]
MIRAALLRIGIRCSIFYWIEERSPRNDGAAIPPLPDGFRVRPLTADEVTTISRWEAEGAPIAGGEMHQHLAHHAKCIGLLRGDDIVGFSWYTLDRVTSGIWPVALQPNEAYLFNIYIRPELRGLKLAPILRHHTFGMLADLGRDTCYSITLAINKPSWQFKKKLGARKMFTGLHLERIGRWHRSWVIKREQRDGRTPSDANHTTA